MRRFRAGDEVVLKSTMSHWNGVQGTVIDVHDSYVGTRMQNVYIFPTRESISQVNAVGCDYRYPTTWMFYSTDLRLLEVEDFNLEFII